MQPFDINRNKCCGDCEVKKADDLFRASSLDLWKKRLKTKAGKFRFEKILSALYSVIGFETLAPDKMSVKTANLLNAYHAEKTRFERIEEFNRNQESK